MPNITPPVGAYLEARSIPEPNTGCLLWTGSVGMDGYGKASSAGKYWRAHRLAWAAAHGDPGDSFVCHKCDTPLCVNPEHLFLGTPAENSRDMTLKGRSTHGTRNGRAKLDPGKVRAIRESKMLHREIAAAFGISLAMVSFVRSGANWKGVA